MHARGFTFLIPLIIIAVLSTATFYFLKPQMRNLINTEPSTLPIVSPSETSSPNPTPTATPMPTATVTPTPSPIATAVKTTAPTSVPVSGPPGAGYSSITVATAKGNFGVRVLSLDLNSARVITDTGNDGDCGDNCTVMPLKDYVLRNNGFAGVNGSYFCPDTYPECASKKNSFDFPVYNSRLNHWINGGNLFWDNRAMVYFDGGGAHYIQNAKDFGGGLTAGITNFPGLLDGGNVQIDDNQSGLSDKQKAKGTKVGLGVRNEKSIMVVIASNVNMQEFAYVFKALGCVSALNLDTGGSTALYYNGSYLAGPGRNLPNAIIFAR